MRAGLLYAGTEFGLFISFDDGAHWQPFELNLPNVPVTDIKIHHNDLVIATQGRSFWILDDVTPLEQATAQTVASAHTLFTPREAIRGRLGGGRGFGGGGRGGPALSGQAEFPTNGATINYYFAQAPSGPLSLDVLDASGKVVRHLSSEATRAANESPAAAPSDDEAPPAFRRAPPVRLGGGGGDESTDLGLQRR